MTRKDVKIALREQQVKMRLLLEVEETRRHLHNVTVRSEILHDLDKEDFSLLQAAYRLLCKIERDTEEAINNPAILETEVNA